MHNAAGGRDGFARLRHAIPATFLALLLLVFLFAAPQHLLGDPDCLWHVAVGQWIVAHRTVPSTDIFSYTFAGAPWIAKEWLSQVLFYGAHSVAGWWGVIALSAAAIVSAYVVLLRWLLARLTPAVAVALTFVAVLLGSVHFIARPHVVVLPLLVVWLSRLTDAVEAGRAPSPWLALLMALWANLHGSFPLGLVLAGLMGLDGLWSDGLTDRRLVLGWARFGVLSAAATLLTPYGLAPLLVPLHMTGAATAMRYIEEWQPLAFDVQGVAGLLALAAALALLARDPRREAARLLTVAVLGAMMCRYVRFESLFGLAAPILVTRALARAWHLAPRRRLDPPAFLVGLLVPTCLSVLGLAATLTAAPDPRIAPARALAAARTAGVEGPVYNDYNFGGFLIASGVKTFVDGRSDQLFVGRFMTDLQEALDSHDDAPFRALLDRYRATWALVRPHSRDARHLARLSGWRKLYEDETAAVYVRGVAALTPMGGVAQSRHALAECAAPETDSQIRNRGVTSTSFGSRRTSLG